MRTVAQHVLPDGSPAAKEIVEAICLARRERTFTLGMASNGFAPKAYLHRAYEPALPDAVAPGRRLIGAADSMAARRAGRRSAANSNGRSGRIGQKHQIAMLMDRLAPHYNDDFWFLSYHAMALSEDGQLAAARMKIEKSVAAN